jgi:hypothetical protein
MSGKAINKSFTDSAVSMDAILFIFV